jgi:hypothetical protein
MRKRCLPCVLKHLAQAEILLNESANGYPMHKWLALGHIAEAEAESPQPIANYLRSIRLEIEDNEDFDWQAVSQSVAERWIDDTSVPTRPNPTNAV